MSTLISSDLSREIKRFYALFAISEFLIDSSIWSFYLTEYCQFSLTEAVAFQAGTTFVSGLLDLKGTPFFGQVFKGNLMYLSKNGGDYAKERRCQ